MNNLFKNLKVLLANTPDRVRVISLIIISVCFLLMAILLNHRMPQTTEEKLVGEISSTSTSSYKDGHNKETDGVSTKNTTEPFSTETSEAIWIPNDYTFGDIKTENYEIKAGDTLWEIAEAKYGSGFFYNKIIEKNPDQIQKFPDGRIGLIQVGVVLKL